MRLHQTLIASIFSLVAGSTGSIIFTEDVPLVGPVLSANFDPSNSTAIQYAKDQFPTLIENMFQGGLLNRTDLVFAVDVFSAATNKSIYSYFHVGEGQNKTLTSGRLDENTIFRIGSISKLFTVYALLAQAGMEVMSHSVTKYLPELLRDTSDPLENLNWEEITVGALASHQAGTGAAPYLYTNYAPNFKYAPVEEILRQARDKRPTISAYRNSMYSDAGFVILGQVISRIVGKPYAEVVNDAIFAPLGLQSTTTKAPTGPNINGVDRHSVDNNTLWGYDVETVSPSGGYYSSAADLRKLGLSILNSEKLSAATTQAWMKPVSGTGSLVELVGAPWEITRLTIPVTPDTNLTRVSDLYIKSGGATDYSAIIALSPDHGIGYSVLVAGSTASPARWPLRQTIGEAFIPAAECAAVENAKSKYSGTFIDATSEGSNITLTVDIGFPGLGIKSLYVNGTESRVRFLGSSAPSNMSVRLYPTGLNSRSRSLSSLYDSRGSIRMAYRAFSQSWARTPRSAVEGGLGLFNNFWTWMSVDDPGLDELILEIQDGRLMSVNCTGLGVVFNRLGC